MKRNTLEIVKQPDGSEVWIVVKTKPATFVVTATGLVKVGGK